MKLCIISDTHCKWNKLKLPECDILISCGDYSFRGEQHIVKNYHKWLNKQKARYIISVQGNHECIDKDTELLTKDGWKNYKEINLSDLVLSLNNEGKSEWSIINKIIVNKAEFIYKYEEGSMNMAITENHRIPYYFYHQYSKKYSDLRYSTLKNLPFSIEIPVSAHTSNMDYSIFDDEIRLLGWVLTDGSYTKKGEVVIYQSKPEGIKKIKSILDNLNMKYKSTTRLRDIKQICGKNLKSIREAVEFYIYAESKDIIKKFLQRNKIPNKELFQSLSSRQLRILFESLMDGDGSWDKSRECGALNGTKEFLDWVQTLAVQCGIRSSLVEYRQNHFRLNLSFNKDKIRIGEFNKKINKEKYGDLVWCLSVPYTNFLVRRDGKAYFTGNCGVEDNFILSKEIAEKECPGVYFIDEGPVEVENLKIWCSSITPFFCNWAWNRFPDELIKHWSYIPNDTDILITHGPPNGILDFDPRGNHVGCIYLLNRIKELKNLKLHCFGHLHSNNGIIIQDGITFVNASICNEQYQPTQPYQVIEI